VVAKKPAAATISYADQLAKVPELTSLGKLLSSSKPIALTESETEYTVTCIKHSYARHTVFQVCKLNFKFQKL
jgi:coatomer subunit gamma